MTIRVPAELRPLLLRARERRLPHGLVLEGPPGIGASTAARAVAAALLCSAPEGNPEQEACGLCKDCVLGVEHPDLHIVCPPEDKRDIGVEQVRGLATTLQRMSVAGRARVAIVEPAERLTEQAQNALLKTLEEPGQATWLLLTSAKPESLLPTVRSRVQRQRLRPWSESDLADLLITAAPDASPDRRAFAARAASGRPGLAMSLVGDGDLEEIDGLLGTWLGALASGTRGRAPHDLVGALLGGGTGGVEAERRAVGVLALLRERLASGLRSGLATVESGSYPPPRIDPWVDALEEVLDAGDDLDLRIPPAQTLGSVLLAVEGCLVGGSPVRVRVPHGPGGQVREGSRPMRRA